jgi:hypothetical protein
MEVENSLLCSQKPATGLHSKPAVRVGTFSSCYDKLRFYHSALALVFQIGLHLNFFLFKSKWHISAYT